MWACVCRDVFCQTLFSSKEIGFKAALPAGYETIRWTSKRTHAPLNEARKMYLAFLRMENLQQSHLPSSVRLSASLYSLLSPLSSLLSPLSSLLSPHSLLQMKMSDVQPVTQIGVEMKEKDKPLDTPALKDGGWHDIIRSSDGLSGNIFQTRTDPKSHPCFLWYKGGIPPPLGDVPLDAEPITSIGIAIPGFLSLFLSFSLFLSLSHSHSLFLSPSLSFASLFPRCGR